MSSSELGNFIRERREALQLTQRDIAEQLGCSNGQVSCWESGAMRPRKHVEKLAEILEVSADELLDMMARKGKSDPDYWKKNGNGHSFEQDFDDVKATLRPMTVQRRVTHLEVDKRLLIAKHGILDEAHSIQAILDVGMLVGDEKTVEVLQMIVDRVVKIEGIAKGLVE